MESCIYRGRVRHRRFEPLEHRFGYRLFMLYLDLDELEDVFRGRWLWSVGRRNLAAWHREDYLGDPVVPLREAVLARVEAALGRRPAGPIRMLTHPRYFGYAFNPVTFYYCFADDGRTVEATVAEITNTPWQERHAYVLPRDVATVEGGAVQRFRFGKSFHVSPFMAMDHDYDWRFGAPGERLAIHMENWRRGRRWFDATLTMARRELTGVELAKALIWHPFMTGKVIAGIYWQALRLWLKRAPFHAHPLHPRAPAGGEP